MAILSMFEQQMSISNLVEKNVEDDEQPIRESQFGNEEAMLFTSKKGSFLKNASQKEHPKSTIHIEQDVIEEEKRDDEKRELEGVEQVESVKLAESRREPANRLEEVRYYEPPKLVESEHKKQSQHQDRSGRIKSIESNQEIIVEEAAGGRTSGIVVRIKTLQEEEVKLPQKVFVELSNETNAAHEQGRSLVKRTKLVEKDNPSWDDDFYYNNNVIVDDNITFVLRAEDHRELGRNQVRNLSLLRKKKEAQPDLEKEEFAIELTNEQVRVATLNIEMTFYEREDILGGVLMPNLSLKPPPDFIGKYNAIDGYEPLFTNKLGSKANCFNFFDGDGWTIPELDNIDVFPPKIQKRNQPKKAVS